MAHAKQTLRYNRNHLVAVFRAIRDDHEGGNLERCRVWLVPAGSTFY
ncbi:MAG TPA: hypothetical protein PLN56_05535 [Methanoregulaceae archaeon]|nr:hypothetical protein [Methanoregulaceae archaeon]HPD10439.1 hypothetical protein [Methanoregulaceae archaeon]HRT15381.1 hypothetical protein [Methanoregulaceae archaeon]HRU31031.1 hypothetical protein [Methanoregulaceae archaeon]